jgi:polysaccharide export outer membrane protein
MAKASLISWGSAALIYAVFVSAASAQEPSPSAPQIAPLAAQELTQRYALQRQDVIGISFPLSPELNQTVTIQPDGYISLQSVGTVYMQGLTVPEAALAIKKAYANILHDPIVDVDLQDYQKPHFTVSGQVGKPGQYEIRSDITISEALAVAGGMTMLTAKTQVFVLHRVSKGWAEVKQVDLKSISRGKKLEQDVLVQPGDMIYVPEKFITNFRKYVPYSVNVGGYAQSPLL